MNPISSYLATVLNTSSPPPSSSLRRSIPNPSTPSSNPLIPTSTTLKSRHVRLNSSPLSSSSSERTFDRSSSSVSASIQDLRSRCSSAGTETAGDDWTLGDLLLSQVEMQGADVAFRLGWLEDKDDSIDGDDSSVDGDEDEITTYAICVMAILPSIEGENGQAPSRKRPLEDAAEGSRKRRRSSGAGDYWDPIREAAAADLVLREVKRGQGIRCTYLSSRKHIKPEMLPQRPLRL
ncbi:hypothetical protein LTR56_013125 [Elasticomyces elasticus]|nr:hypothetical protein LTR56_013125 [Elasticomyces elasticus]KAK3656699.1 hypothetical protein LTR22_009678 [Elasticomyces elasticus]KAK4921571.1 hypothetical protein LTR49_011041 [Elasticomyces elasticus]KAK5760259.1 hypothetical protein LTS12_009643 [Elasticomyces elasticus]